MGTKDPRQSPSGPKISKTIRRTITVVNDPIAAFTFTVNGGSIEDFRGFAVPGDGVHVTYNGTGPNERALLVWHGVVGNAQGDLIIWANNTTADAADIPESGNFDVTITVTKA